MELKDILKQIPEEYKKACWESKAMDRRRGIQDEETLLSLCSGIECCRNSSADFILRICKKSAVCYKNIRLTDR